jgi:putative transcriptional regulator
LKSQQEGTTQMVIIKATRERAEKAIRETDWARIDAQTDEEIERNVASDPDAAPLLTEGETVAGVAKWVRRRLGLSQVEFAARYHIPIGTLRDWEQGRVQPDTAALSYLRVIAREPEITAKAFLPAGA